MKKWLIFLLPVFVVFIFPLQVLMIENDHITKMYVINEGSIFSIRWVHSVEHEEWEEFFKIKEHQIYLDSTRFKTFGAGVPNQAGTDSYLKDGWVYMVNIDRKVGSLILRAGSDTNHRLYTKGNIYSLSQINQEERYELKVKRVALIEYVLCNIRSIIGVR